RCAPELTVPGSSGQDRLADTLAPLPSDRDVALRLVDDHHLAASFVGFHDAMGLTDLPEAEDPGWLRLEPPRCHLFADLLERQIGQWELRSAEHEAAEEGQVDAAGHLQERVEIGNRRQTAEPACQAGATTSA